MRSRMGIRARANGSMQSGLGVRQPEVVGAHNQWRTARRRASGTRRGPCDVYTTLPSNVGAILPLVASAAAQRYSAQHLSNRLRQSDSIQQRAAEHQDRINALKDLSVAVLRCALCTESMSCTQWHLSLDVHHLYRVQGSRVITVACAVRVAALPCWL